VLRVRYVADWGNLERDTSAGVRLGDTVFFEHAWQDTGTFEVRAATIPEEGKRISDWSEPLTVVVVNQGPGTPDTPLGPDTLAVDSFGEFRARAADPEDDLLRYRFNWGDGDTGVTGWYSPGAWAAMLHAWSSAGTWPVRAQAEDATGHRGSWSAPHYVLVTGK
jgi:hypothetical protein